MMDECMACEIVSGRLPVPGGELHQTDSWVVDHSIGPLGVGTLIVKPKRHVVHVADLSDDEAAELGPLLRDAARVSTALTDPEQVYVSLWSHAGGVPGHIHFVVQPVTADTIAVWGRGPKMQVAMFDADEYPDPDEVERFAEGARPRFATSG
jgi:diadenosine tetraphosphate (Ap4A) HIT family hydrolase